MSKTPPLNAVRAFEVAARHASFKRAAEELNVTHGAVSRQVAHLEAWLGTALFRRLNRQVVLTAAGHTLYSEVRPALAKIALAAASVTQQTRSTTLVVNAPPTFTMRWLIPRLSSFLRENKLIEVRLETSLKPADFAGGAYDCAIRRAPETPAGLRSHTFLSEMLTPVCIPGMIDIQDDNLVDALRGQQLIHTATAPTAWLDWFASNGMGDLRPERAVTFEELFFTLQAAANGLGVAIAPAVLVTDDIIDGKLCFPLATYHSRNHDYRILYPETSEKRAAIEKFCAWLSQEGAKAEAEVKSLMGAGKSRTSKLEPA